MGILDDAIREHLDLKRRLGAEDSELARLEDEAFGPPTRPGDPDFPEDEPEAAVGTPLAEPPSEELPAAQTEPAAHAAAPTAAEPEQAPPAEAEQGGLYDDTGEELDLELDLDQVEEAPIESAEPPPPEPPPPPLEAVDPPSEEVPAAPPVEPPIESLDTVEHKPDFEPPIESLDTVEHHFEGAIEDTGEAEAVEAPPADTDESEVVEEEPIEDTGEVEVVEGELELDEEGEEDVLEETPEFLRDQPEDDELWFEQGEPKDFDF